MKSLTVQQVADRHGVTETTVLAWIRSGELRAVNVARRPTGRPQWRIPPEALEAFEASRAATPEPPRPQRRRRRADRDVIAFY